MWHGQVSRARRMLEDVMTADDSILDPACPLQFPDQVIAFHRWLLYPPRCKNQHHTHQCQMPTGLSAPPPFTGWRPDAPRFARDKFLNPVVEPSAVSEKRQLPVFQNQPKCLISRADRRQRTIVADSEIAPPLPLNFLLS